MIHSGMPGPHSAVGSASDSRVRGPSFIQRTLDITTVFVTKDFAVKSNLLLYRNMKWTRPKHE